MNTFFETYGYPVDVKSLKSEQATKNEFWTPEYIWHYENMNVVRVCTVNQTKNNNWYYSDINKEVMFSDHTSWVYFITINGYIVKIGETGHTLGIKSSKWISCWEIQPITGSKSRLGRYRKGDATDERIRSELREDIKSEKNKIEFYAIKCEELNIELPILGTINSQIHKVLEKKLLDYYHDYTGIYPRLHTGRC